MENVLTGPTTEAVTKETRDVVKKIIQISFAGDADLTVVKSQLAAIKAQYEGNEFVHLFLPRKIVQEKGFPTTIVDMLDEVLCENQSNPLADAANFDEFMSKIDGARLELSTKTDLLIVLGTNLADGVIKEVVTKAPQVIFWK